VVGYGELDIVENETDKVTLRGGLVSRRTENLRTKVGEAAVSNDDEVGKEGLFLLSICWWRVDAGSVGRKSRGKG
jgi:hypothetical protein